MAIDKKYIYMLPMRVRDYEVDSEGIVNNANYQHYMEHTRHEFCRMAGLSFRQMHQRGIDPVVTRVEIDYKHSLGLGDEMVSCLNMSRRGPLFIFQQDIYKPDGTLMAAGIVKVACIVNGKLTRGEELAKAFAQYL